MANNYRKFSAVLRLETAEQTAWCREELARRRLTPISDDAPVEDEADLERYESLADFQWTVTQNDGLLFYAEESGDVEHVAEFVQAFLARYNPANCWWISWCDYCDAIRVNEFTGGAAFVTATEIKYIEAQTWARDMEAAHETARSA